MRSNRYIDHQRLGSAVNDRAKQNIDLQPLQVMRGRRRGPLYFYLNHVELVFYG
jgi:hypothetical protein